MISRTEEAAVRRRDRPTRVPGPAARRGRWRELFVFRANPPARVELWIGILGFASVLLVWGLVTATGLIGPWFLPSPVAVVQALWFLFRRITSGTWPSASPACGSPSAPRR